MRILSLALPFAFCCAVNGATVAVVVKPGAAPVEKLAASELARYLGKLYPADRFSAAAAVPANGMSIVVGTPGSAPGLAQFKDRLGKPESFVVSAAGSTGYVAGADPSGALYTTNNQNLLRSRRFSRCLRELSDGSLSSR